MVVAIRGGKVVVGAVGCDQQENKKRVGVGYSGLKLITGGRRN